MKVASLRSPLVRRAIETINEGTVLEVNATSIGGYSGPGTFFFTIQANLIEHLEIR
jgi:hypothetical protein